MESNETLRELVPEFDSVSGSDRKLLYAFSQSLSGRVGLSEIFWSGIWISRFSRPELGLGNR
jgi:hypothetical protein